MRPHRPIPAWIACLALLLHLLLMSASGSMPVQTKRLMGWGGYCGSAEAPVRGGDEQFSHAEHADHDHPDAAHHALMQHCCCGVSAVSLAALPPAAPAPIPSRLLARLATLPQPPPAALSPRRQWPSLNPRASPSA